MSRRLVLLAVAVAVTLLLSGCAAGSNPLTGAGRVGSTAGFWLGLWQGMICPIALVISWFNSNVSIYEVHNNGGWYNTGFVLGAGAWGILGGSGSRSKRREGR